ncbi:hypothetical protein BDW02DRAFT_385806 [Decorospora gaudefroyi]|uniref:Uncharacterized protein n=1 Tax=Decorospora gaudefroyi TaxID=184978 RepID=A0A6A5KAK4_9PLEO|nr:hypothetical protein BDW02DRAFT_385806 [Decorospora gaudefroyi]
MLFLRHSPVVWDAVIVMRYHSAATASLFWAFESLCDLVINLSSFRSENPSSLVQVKVSHSFSRHQSYRRIYFGHLLHRQFSAHLCRRLLLIQIRCLNTSVVKAIRSSNSFHFLISSFQSTLVVPHIACLYLPPSHPSHEEHVRVPVPRLNFGSARHNGTVYLSNRKPAAHITFA